ncbi:MAG: beta-propeller fold lactonase family protein, partial [Nitrospirota bacterium]
ILTITGVTQSASGSVLITGGGTGLTFQPMANFNGTTTFTYTISDGNGGTDTATVTVTVNAVNDPPVANAGVDQSVIVSSGVTLDGSGSADVDNAPLTYLWTVASPSGSTSTLLNATSTSPTFTPNIGGLYTATLVVEDGTATSSDTVVITVIPMYTLTVINAGMGTGTATSTPGGINCGTGATDCSESYASSTSVILTAIPVVGSVFSAWSGSGITCPGTGTCAVEMDANKSVTAMFTLMPTLVSIAVTPGTPSISGTSTQQFEAIGTYSDNSTSSLTTMVNWSSSATTTATIGMTTGLATGMSSGTAAPGFLYVGGRTNQNLLGYEIKTDGTLIAVPGTPIGSESPEGIAVHPTKKFLYVAETLNNRIQIFNMAADGGLTFATTTPTLNCPHSIAMSPSGLYAYIVYAGLSCGPDVDKVSFYNVNATTGALTFNSVYSTGATSSLYQVVYVDPQEKVVIVTSFDSKKIVTFKIDPADGTLGSPNTLGDPIPIATPVYGAFHPSLPYFYVPFFYGSYVIQYLIDYSTGALTSVDTLIMASGPWGNNNPHGITINSTGKFAYVTDYGPQINSVYSYNIDSSTGNLSTSTSLSSLVGLQTGGRHLTMVALDPINEKFAYVTHFSEDPVTGFGINSNGSLDASSLYRGPATNEYGSHFIISTSGSAGGASQATTTITATYPGTITISGTTTLTVTN